MLFKLVSMLLVLFLLHPQGMCWCQAGHVDEDHDASGPAESPEDHAPGCPALKPIMNFSSAGNVISPAADPVLDCTCPVAISSIDAPSQAIVTPGPGAVFPTAGARLYLLLRQIII
jgi:hypothetical protein